MKAFLLTVIIAAAIAAIVYAVARDALSYERAVYSGKVTIVTDATGGHKTTPQTASSFEAIVDGGRTVHVIAPDVSGLAKDSPVTISEMATPWGQVWYRRKTN